MNFDAFPSEGLRRRLVAPAALASQIARHEANRLRDLHNADDQLEILDCAAPEACKREEARALSQGYSGQAFSG